MQPLMNSSGYFLRRSIMTSRLSCHRARNGYYRPGLSPKSKSTQKINHMTRTEYLQRPLIKDVVYEITPDKIRVSNTNTVFVEARNCRRLTLQEVRQHFRELQQAAKTSGTFERRYQIYACDPRPLSEILRCLRQY